MDENDKLIVEQLKTLPLNLQQAIEVVPWKMLIQEIGKAELLNPEQIASLEQETMFIIYAFESPDDYIPNIVREVTISEELAYSIAEAVAEKVFDPIQKKSEEVPRKAAMKQPLTTAVSKGPKETIVAPTSVPPASAQDSQPPPKTPAGQAGMAMEIAQEIHPQISIPDYRYPEGNDPYREPLV